MGEVYLAEDTRLGREVAMKFLPAGMERDPERRARFFTEARAASALRSSNIAAIYDIGEDSGSVYLVMEYVEGETVAHRLTRGPLPVMDSVRTAMQVADALSEAHERGIVHRDIKSANIIVTPRGQVKVLDFGLAKFTEAPGISLESQRTFERTVAGTVLGTASYMSPEQALGRAVDARSDLFSLGVVFFEMLTGRLPFDGRTFSEMVDAIVNQPPAPVARFNYEVGPPIEAVLRKALEKKPEFRYQSARDLYIDLRTIKTDLEEQERHGTSVSGSHGHAQVRDRIAAAPGNAIAVMTFSNITREPADEWIGSGIAETVSADLKNIKRVTVIGRERIFDALRTLQSGIRDAFDDRFAIEIGRGLGARWIVSGAYQRLGNLVRITARFVEVETGVVLRNVKIDGRLDDIFALQDRIVFDLMRDLNLQLEGSAIQHIEQQETRSVEAYELFSRGMMTLRMASRDAPDRAIYLFEKALAIDPEYAEAWAGLGGGYQLKGNFLNMPELLERAIDAERKALALHPALVDAYNWMGGAELALGRVEAAIAALQKAVDVDPSQARGYAALARAHWLGRGDLRRGVEGFEQAVRINPQFGYAHLQLAFLYTELGEYAQAAQAARYAVDLQERYASGEEGLLIVGAHTRLGYVHYREGRYGEAIGEYQAELMFLTAADHVLKERALIELHQKFGAAYLRAGQQADAERHLRASLKMYEDRAARGADDLQTKYYAAAAHALGGDVERAARYLAETFPRYAAINRVRIAGDPDLAEVRPLLAQRGLL